MKKKHYQSPTTQVVSIQQHACLLAGSTQAGRTGYGTASGDYDQEWN